MRSFLIAAFAAFLLAALIALLLPRVLGMGFSGESIRAEIDALESEQGRFRELVIGLRHGVTFNYDEANYWSRRILERVGSIDALLADRPEFRQPHDDFRHSVADFELLWEDFKLHNSVVRNSMQYVRVGLPRLLELLHLFDLPYEHYEKVSTLSTLLLVRALGGGADRSSEIERLLRELGEELPREDWVREELRLLAGHARVINTHVPALEAVMARLVHSGSRESLARMNDLNTALLLRSQQRAVMGMSLFGLAFVSLGLVLGLVLVRHVRSLRIAAEQAALTRSVTDHAGLGVLALDVRGRIAFANPEMERMVGRTGLPGRMSRELGFLADAGENAPSSGDGGFFPGPATGEVRRVSGALRNADRKRVVPVEVTTAPLVIDGEHGLVAVVQDISERLERERDLRLAGAVFRSSHQGIIITDANGTILRVNPAYCAITGYTAAELVGRNPRMMQSGQQGTEFYREMWKDLREQGSWAGELYNCRKNGSTYLQWANIDAVHTEQGELLYVGIVSDISELVNTRERLAHLVNYDALTGLPNRSLLLDRLTQAIAQVEREDGGLAVLMADLDNFKVVNDSLGHAAGDELLAQVAQRLQQSAQGVGTIARLGGDEFVLLIDHLSEPEDVAMLALAILEDLSQSYQVRGTVFAGGASLGCAFWPMDGETPEELMKHAEVAMYRAKEQGRNGFQFFTPDMADSVIDAMRVESGLRAAIEARQLALHFQPQIDAGGHCVGAEALLRWNSDDLGWVSPSRFIPVAERSGLILPLSEFVLHEACRQCRDWRRSLDPGFKIAVNLSAAQFRQEGLLERVAEVLHQYALPGSALELELTETLVMKDVSRAQAVIAGLKSLGCSLSIDDFGTGYSSLAYLRRFDVNTLKIDKSFVDGMGRDTEDTAVVAAIVSLARSLGLSVVAEGVETLEQLKALREITGNRFVAQGYFFSEPIPATRFERLFPGFRKIRLVEDA